MKKIFSIILLLVLLAGAFGGCGKMVNSYMSFSIDGFDNFFNKTNISDKETYIKDGNMEFARMGDTIICPFIKETTHEERSILVYVYKLNENSSSFTIDSVVLSTKNDVILCQEDLKNKTIKLTPVTDEMSFGSVVVSDFCKNEHWFYSGNELQLSLKITVNDGTDVTEENLDYAIKLIGHKRHVMPT